ncbi:MAG: hypothetical protein N3E45_12525 [Oscillatoriaceae bacterium SKW80]|nr:hypothetical protein [Oscillatoriaceae bacterium SKYG93]MCX8121627.1 hypothetical protein [Oscillatoriaceae bacterium SKW80]MDW8453935.1 hypothetical protein [Oscillatoriaceae cyanobacterium SKYGB_i_bin93]HIK28820.1 hypothetical protein [Oscillatoriaceae cyanobacterium M7585_C2015_266]
MSITRLHKFLTATTTKTSSSPTIFWFSLSLTFAAIYGLMGLQQAFSAEYVVQDDARQHTFWMQRFVDGDLFPGDLIANYFQTVAPTGYTFLYQLMAALGINPLLLSKLLPPVLGLIVTGYSFGISMLLLPVPLAGFLSTLLLNHYLWMRDDLISGTPVAFVYPLFTAFLYYFLQRYLLGSCVAIALLGLFYPQCVFICAGILILQLVQWKNGCLRFSPERRDYQFCAFCLGTALAVILLYALKSHGYGPVITAAEAKTWPEFWSKGKSKFFFDDPWHFWITAQRSGILPRFGTIVPLVASFLLPLLLFYPAPFPLLKKLSKNIAILVQITLASLAMFFISHALLFKLHLPSRYTEHSLRVVTALGAGIAITAIIDAVLNWADDKQFKSNWRHLLALVTTCVLLVALGLYPNFIKGFPKTNYIVGEVPLIYKFFSQQPKDILIASLAKEANNLPIFSKRSILVGSEGYPVPYHKGYYAKIRARAVALIEAHYSADMEELRRFINKYKIDFWLVEKGAFTSAYLQRERWIMQYQAAAKKAISLLEEGTVPALARLMNQCSVLEVKDLIVLPSQCILAKSVEGKGG